MAGPLFLVPNQAELIFPNLSIYAQLIVRSQMRLEQRESSISINISDIGQHLNADVSVLQLELTCVSKFGTAKVFLERL